ncbi:MAG: FecR domain-containing protein [Lacunisphaera sp.]
MTAGPLTRAEADALQTWLDSAEGNEALLDEFQQLHQRVRATLPALRQSGRLPGVPRMRRPGETLQIWTGGLAAAAALVVAGLWFGHRPQQIATVAAQRQTVTLTDGTVADLNARTSLSVSLSGSERRVRLASGEAYFAVARDAMRPFYVETPAGTVRVTGTHFNVRADDPATLEVTVLEGSVAVKAGAGATDYALKPQGRLTFDGARAAVSQLTPDVAEDTIAWREGPRRVRRRARARGDRALRALPRPRDRGVAAGGDAAARRALQARRLRWIFARRRAGPSTCACCANADGRVRIVPRG